MDDLLERLEQGNCANLQIETIKFIQDGIPKVWVNYDEEVNISLFINFLKEQLQEENNNDN